MTCGARKKFSRAPFYEAINEPLIHSRQRGNGRFFIRRVEKTQLRRGFRFLFFAEEKTRLSMLSAH